MLTLFKSYQLSCQLVRVFKNRYKNNESEVSSLTYSKTERKCLSLPTDNMISHDTKSTMLQNQGLLCFYQCLTDDLI